MTAITHPAIYPLTLYYDGACPMCRAEMHNLMLRNSRNFLALSIFPCRVLTASRRAQRSRT